MKPTNSSADLEKLKRIADINRKTALVLESRQNVNNLADLLDIIREDLNIDRSSEQKCSQLLIDTTIKSLNKIFIRFIHTKELAISSEESEANKTYKKWLTDVYGQTNTCLGQLIGNESYSKTTQKLSLNCLMKFVTEEGKYPFKEMSDKRTDTFADQLLTSICRRLMSKDSDNRHLIQNYAQNYLNFDDCIYYTLKAIHLILKEFSNEEVVEPNGSIEANSMSAEEMFIRNIYELLSAIRLKPPKELVAKKTVEKKSEKRVLNEEPNVQNLILCVRTQPNQKCFKINYGRDADLFATVWTKFLSQRLPKDLYKNVLLILDKQLIQHFRNPLVLTDFLIDSYDIGGVVSLLSLSTLYVLISKCNLNYPNFYQKLYAIVSPTIINAKYRARFLFWTDVFLSSTHISAQVVASFIKRLSRIALTAPTDAILILLPLIGNLLIRHPILVSMSKTLSNGTTTDPFDDQCNDPEHTGAIDSCLWEIKSLQKHFHPQVAKTALFINNALPNKEWDLSELLETSFDDIIENSRKKLSEQKQLTYDDKHSTQLLAYLK